MMEKKDKISARKAQQTEVLLETNKELMERIKELERRLGLNSQNSSNL